MKKFLVLICLVLVTNVANARTEYYTSVKVGAGDTTIYVNDDDKLGDYLIKVSEENTGLNGYKYSDFGLLWEISAAVGLDWAPGKMYVKKNPYDWFHLRLETEFGYNNYRENGKLRYDYTITDRIKVKYDHFFALLNGYADFRIDNIVPYVGLGVGYGFGKEEIKVTNEHGRYSDSVDDSGVIYAVHLGVGYKYSDITTLDFGVRRVYAPTEDDGMDVFDTVRLGARFRM
ncbi:MAG: outer membrane beta-barrel protein [Alphaproteobacteria bacterium]|nr:outer membrane beta-barrel protein [Alphaproteobacteria bacterium]